MKRKVTALLLAMTFVFATVAPTMAASKQVNASANKTATVSVEKPKRRWKPLAAVKSLLSTKKEDPAKVDDVDAKKDEKKDPKNENTNLKGTVTVSDPTEANTSTDVKKPGDGGNSQTGKTENNAATDKEEKVKITFSIINKSSDEELIGAKLEILKKVDGSLKEELKWDSKKDQKPFELGPGEYVFKMEDKLKGYKMPVDIPFEIKDGKITVDGKELEPVKGKNVLIMAAEKEESKTFFGIRDIAGKEIVGAELKIVEKPKKSPSGDVTTERTWNLGKTPEELKLDPGEYELIVTKLPDDYKVEKTSVDFVITKDGEIVVAEADKAYLETKDSNQTLFLKAESVEPQIFFGLKDSNGKGIIGLELKIQGNNGKVINLVSGERAIGVNVSELPDGTYVFSQTNVRYGHEAAEPIQFTMKDGRIISASSGLTNLGPYQELTLLSKNISSSVKRVVTFSRVDSLGKALAGAEIEIYKDGTKIDSWKSGSDHHKLELEAGVYRYHEAAVVLGHKIAKDFEFEVKADGSIVLRGIQLGEMVKLKEGGLIVVGEAGGKLEEDPNKKPEEKPGQNNQKKPTTDKKAQAKNHWVEFDVAKKDGTLLEGAVVEIYQNGKLLESWTTSNTGYKTQLQPGSYRFHTKTAPQGYQLARDFNFAVNRDGSITLGKLQSGDTVTAKDGRIVVYGDPISATGTRTSGTTTAASNGRLPKTGDGISPVFYAVGLAAVGAVILGIGIKKRRESVDEVK